MQNKEFCLDCIKNHKVVSGTSHQGFFLCDIIFYQSKYCFKWLINNTWRSESGKAWTSYLKNVFLTSCIVSTFILWGVIHCSLITSPCHLRCRLSTNHCFEKSLFTCKVKKKFAGCLNNIVAVRTAASSGVFPLWNMTFTLLNGCSHWLPGEVRGRLSRREVLNMLCDDNPGNSGPFLDSHWEGREGSKKKKKIQFDRLKKSWKDDYFVC